MIQRFMIKQPICIKYHKRVFVIICVKLSFFFFFFFFVCRSNFPIVIPISQVDRRIFKLVANKYLILTEKQERVFLLM